MEERTSEQIRPAVPDDSGSMVVRLAQLGRGVFRLALNGPTTVLAAAQQAGLTLQGFEVRLNGRKVEASAILSEGDLVTIVPLIKGGTGNAGSRTG